VTLSPEEVGKAFGRSADEVVQAVAEAKRRLLAARAQRVPPLRDEKILTSWNGLMIGTLAEAGRVLGARRFIDAAVAGATFLWERMLSGGRLLHGWAGGKAKGDAYLDDHAFVASALLDLYEATGERVYVDRAGDLVAALGARFHDDAGAYFFTAHDGERLIARTKSGADGSLPAGNAVAAHVLLRLHHLTGEPSYRTRAEEVLRLYHDEAASNPFGYAAYLQALELYTEGPTEVVVVGAREAPDTAALWATVASAYLPHRTLVRVGVGDKDVLAPARERPAVDGRATAYVCRHFTCSSPITDPADLERLLGSTS